MLGTTHHDQHWLFSISECDLTIPILPARSRTFSMLRRFVAAIVWFTLIPLPTQAGGSFQFTTLDFPGATFTSAYGINDAGQIVGGYSDPSTNQGFLYSNG